MTKVYYVKLEKHGKEHVVFVNATSELDAIMEARNVTKDFLNNAHIICVSLA